MSRKKLSYQQALLNVLELYYWILVIAVLYIAVFLKKSYIFILTKRLH